MTKPFDWFMYSFLLYRRAPDHVTLFALHSSLSLSVSVCCIIYFDFAKKKNMGVMYVMSTQVSGMACRPVLKIQVGCFVFS